MRDRDRQSERFEGVRDRQKEEIWREGKTDGDRQTGKEIWSEGQTEIGRQRDME